MYMEWEDIKEKYESSWIFMINCRTTEIGGILGGEVVISTKHWEELVKVMDEYKNEESETIFFGIPPKDLNFLL